jgi:hypothetical protein
MTDGITIFCCIYRTLETACYDNPPKSELLLRDHFLKSVPFSPLPNSILPESERLNVFLAIQHYWWL